MNLRRGFFRLFSVIWAFGAGLVFAWSNELLQPPFDPVCRTEIDPPYRECLTEEARGLRDSESFTEQLMGRFRGEWELVDPTRAVSRWQTARYREAARTVAWRQTLWFGATWGSYALVIWIVSGFRRAQTTGDEAARHENPTGES